MDDISSALAGRGGATAAHPVVYLPRGFADTETSQVDLGQLDPYDLPALAPWVIEHQHDLFFVKARDWNSEHEFRVVHSPPEPSEDGYVYVPFRAESVRAVILGEQFPRAELPAARVACDRAELEMFRIEWRSGLPQPIPVSQ